MTRPSTDDDVAALFARRQAPVEDLAGQAEAVAATCHAMAVRFHRGGKLVVFGTGTESTDALHVAVEFVHPVIVGQEMRDLEFRGSYGLGSQTGAPFSFAVFGAAIELLIGRSTERFAVSKLDRRPLGGQVNGAGPGAPVRVGGFD